MLTLTDRASLRAAALNSGIDPPLRAVLRLRFEQLGGAGAHFHVLQQGDSLATTEHAIGFPLTLDDAPCWEWIERHPGGWTEVVFILSDDGPAEVLFVPDAADPSIADLIQQHTSPAADREAARTA